MSDSDSDHDIEYEELEDAPALSVEDLPQSEPASKKKNKRLKALTPEQLQEYAELEEKRGILYMSRVPPYMKPQKLRHLLSDFGEVLRIYLTPEDSAIARRRAKSGGSRVTKFLDGWIEFADKRIAKRVALTLNATPIGGSRRSFHHDDLWNLKYLSGFKWRHLSDKMAADKATKDARIRAELAAAKSVVVVIFSVLIFDKDERLMRSNRRSPYRKRFEPSPSERSARLETRVSLLSRSQRSNDSACQSSDS